MSAQNGVNGRLSMHLGPGWIIVGYVLGLFADTAGVVIFPFSIITMGLFAIIIGAFFVVTIPMLVMVYLFLMVIAYRASIKFGRRLIFGAGHTSEGEGISKPSLKYKNLTPEPLDGDLWDRWIDGAW